MSRFGLGEPVEVRRQWDGGGDKGQMERWLPGKVVADPRCPVGWSRVMLNGATESFREANADLRPRSRTSCGIHGDDTTAGRCASCDAGAWDCPECGVRQYGDECRACGIVGRPEAS